MEYNVVETFESGIKRYYVCGFEGKRGGPFSFKRSALRYVRALRMNQKIMNLVNKSEHLMESDEEAIFEILEEAIDRANE